MSKPRKYINKILKLLDKEPLNIPEITRRLGIHRKIVRDTLIWTTGENMTCSDGLGQYYLTPLGKSSIDSPEMPHDSVSFEVASQIVDSLKIRQESPKAKCIIQMKDASATG